MITREAVADLFPFSIEVGLDGVLISCGRTLSDRLQGIGIGLQVSDSFRALRPKMELTGESISGCLRHSVFLQCMQSEDFVLMGAFYRLEDSFIYLGSPRLGSIEEIETSGLEISDFAPHDVVLTYMFMLQQVNVTSKQNELALDLKRKSAAELKQYVDLSQELIIRIAGEGEILFVNPAAADLLSVTLKQTRIQDLVGESSRTVLEDAMLNTCGIGTRADLELVLVSRDGKNIRVEGQVIRVGKKDASRLILFTDITERKAAQLELSKSIDRLRQGQKIEAIGRFAGGIAHDFNNYLAVVMGAASLLEQSETLSTGEMQDVKRIMVSSEKGAAMARRLLMLSRRSPVRKQQSELVSCANDFADILKSVVGPNIRVELKVECSTVTVGLESGQFEQVLVNLLSNARDAMPNGGMVLIRLAVNHDTNEALIDVLDEGTGIEEGIRATVYEPFFTTKEPESGTGLGLSVVHGIIKEAGGEVSFRSRKTLGTAFHIRIPIIHPEAVDLETPVAAELDAKQSLAILDVPILPTGRFAVVVEDVEPLMLLVERFMTQLGFEVVVFPSYHACMDYFSSERRVPEVFISDVCLGDGDGLELATALSDRGLLDKVLIMTGYADLSTIDELLVERGWKLLMKPFAIKDLRRVVTQLVH
jgi:two-component system cell cycle sensor histidine kinase/response regulator CckA